MGGVIWLDAPKEFEIELDKVFSEFENTGHPVYVVGRYTTGPLWSRFINVWGEGDATSATEKSYLSDKEKSDWVASISLWYGIDIREASARFQMLYARAVHVLQSTQPSLVVGWNPYCHVYGVFCNVAENMGIRLFYSERGLLSRTIIIDSIGLLAKSNLHKVTAEFLLNSDRSEYWLERGKKELATIKLLKPSIYPQQKLSVQDRAWWKSGKVSVLVFGGAELASAAFPPDNPDKHLLMPFFSGFEELLKMIAVVDGVRIVYKPHPEGSLPVAMPGNGIARVVLSDPNELIAAADVVISCGTKLEVNALAEGKKLILAGYGLLWGKGCADEAGDAAQLVRLISASIPVSEGASEKMTENLCRYLGYFRDEASFDFSESKINAEFVNTISRRMLSMFSLNGKPADCVFSLAAVRLMREQYESDNWKYPPEEKSLKLKIYEHWKLTKSIFLK